MVFLDIEEEMRKMQERMDKIFAAIREPVTFGLRRPIAGMQETPESIIATLELPGVEKEDIILEVTENRIKVKAEKRKTEEVKKKGFYKAVKEAGAFYHEETLPAKIIPEEAEAEYKNGILKITLPKKEKVKVKIKKVKIK